MHEQNSEGRGGEMTLVCGLKWKRGDDDTTALIDSKVKGRIWRKIYHCS